MALGSDFTGGRPVLAATARLGDNGAMHLAPALLLLLWLPLGACAGNRYFAPRENLNGTGPGGYPAAVYPVGATPGLGEVRVWSTGARVVEIDGASVVEVAVGFELENTGAETLAIDTASLVCAELWVGEQRQQGLAPVRFDGQAEAGPGTTSRLDVTFRPEHAERARAVTGFTLRFAVVAAGRQVLVQALPFAPHVVPDHWYHDDWFWGRGRYWPGITYGVHHGYWCR